ncbi:MAG: hypothetical protein HYU66_24200 [Armatimonadetes bacterium]|nr:hypothetical protein [Armatimonadota bacterium]
MRNAFALALLCSLTLALAQADGPVTLGGVTYDRVDPGPAFTEASRPAQDWEAPAPSAAETAAGLLAYVSPDPGDYRTYRRPKPDERVDRLSAFLTPGEDEPVCFAVYSLAALEGLTVTVDLNDAPLTVDIRHEHCWPQRTGWRSRGWYLTPELLLPCANGRKMVPQARGVLQEVPFDLAAEQTQGFWLTLTAPVGAQAGRYEAAVTVAGAGRPALRLPLSIDLLPFALQRPKDRSWLLYGDSGRWSGMSDAQVLAELKDYRRHGMDGLIEGPMGTPDVSRIKEGKVTFDASPYLKYAGLCHQAGMDGPHVIGSAGPELVRNALGLQTDLNKGEWPAEIRAGVQAVAKAALEATRDLPAKWYYYGVDEPTGDNTYAIQDYQAWHDAGAHTYATFYVPSFLEKASAYLTAPCFVVGLVSAEQSARAAREACEKTGAEFWWYGTGSYVNPFPQEGFMFHNRYGAGLLFWKTGARAEATWTFCRPHEDVFNDFDGSRANSAEPKEQATAYPHFTRADDWSTYQGALPTIAWESLREGVDDYLYLHTLDALVGEAQASPREAVRQAGAEARATLDAAAASVPWVNPMGPVGFETRRLQQVRRLVADRIVGLQAALAGQAAAPAEARGRSFSLVVSVADGGRRAALPAASVAGPDAPPTVDGRLDDACWRQAARLGGFSDIRTGEPSPLATSARIVADEQALYVGFDCPEPDLAHVTALEREHDGSAWLEDSVELFVAGAARQPYAHVILTTGNVRLDEAGQDRAAWEPRLETAVSRGDGRWSAELALPWPELARAGVPRAAVLTLNVGRNRYAGADPQPHTAWSCPYGGFHEPARFGLAFLVTGPLALTGLTLPDRWGAQTVRATFRNRGPAAATVELALEGDAPRSVKLAPGAERAVELPVALRRPGSAPLALAWGPAGEPPARVALAVETPEPVSLGAVAGLVNEGAEVAVPVQVNLAPAEQSRHRLVLSLHDGRAAHAQELAAVAGRRVRLAVRSTGVARLGLRLVDVGGRDVWRGPELSFLVLPD